MIRLKSNTGKVHIKSDLVGTLCNCYFDFLFYKSVKVGDEEAVTCKHCLNILKKNNPNREESLIIAESFMPDSKELIKTEVCFGSKVNSIETFFETKEEKAAYIKGIKDAQSWHYIQIDGELI